jgi:hypothetical protein
MVHLQPCHRDSSVGGDPYDFERVWFRPPKAVDPPLGPGIEQRHRLSRLRILPLHVRPFTRVAMRARQREIRHLCPSALGSGQDMVNLKATNLELRGQLTVFTAIARTFDHRVSQWVRTHTHAPDNTSGSAARRRSKAA